MAVGAEYRLEKLGGWTGVWVGVGVCGRVREGSPMQRGWVGAAQSVTSRRGRGGEGL